MDSVEAPIQSLEILASRTMMLSEHKDFVFVVTEAAEIISYLECHVPNDLPWADSKVWVQRHPIAQALAHKIRNFTCINPEDTLRRALIQVSQIASNNYAQTSQVGQESLRQASATINGGASGSVLADDAQRERVARARKRLRR